VPETHSGALLRPALGELLPSWMARQRWYAAKNRSPRLRLLGSFRVEDPDGRVGLETLLLVDEGGSEAITYQVPLTYRDAPLRGHDSALVATAEHSVLGTRWIYDAPHDPVYARMLCDLVQERARAADGGRSGVEEVSVEGSRHPRWEHELSVHGSRVLKGEQSNTSVIIDAETPDGGSVSVICKVFRQLAHGDNPDIVLQEALAEAGSTRVPAPVGHLTGRWARPDGARSAPGHLAAAQEFLAGSEDAWRVALRAARAGEDFTERAAALGAATSEVHTVLGSRLPTEPARPERVEEALHEMTVRLATAINEVPSLAAHESAVRDVLARASTQPWPDFQRVHGDFHLGQVLDVPGRGWVLLDFEGEPLRPLDERNRTDQPVRDLAGMLRSFDYAGGSIEHDHPDLDLRAWVSAVQEAFLDGYVSAGGPDPRDGGLLTTFELDKALYEVVYEARNRPTWLTIPATAIDRLIHSISPTTRGPTKEATP
jgi:maltokinase